MSRLANSLTVWLTTLGLLLPAVGLGRERDPGAPPNPYFAPLVDDLDGQNIDVLNSWSSPGAQEIPSRPTLSPLDGFDGHPEPEWVLSRQWMIEFERGMAGVMLLVKDDGSTLSADEDEMRSRWLAAPRDMRAFISFTRQDATHAANVRTVMEARGYSVFIYINDPDSKPRFPPARVGEFFMEAGHHFVLDSINARGSDGVFFEKLMLERIRRPPGDISLHYEMSDSIPEQPKLTQIPGFDVDYYGQGIPEERMIEFARVASQLARKGATIAHQAISPTDLRWFMVPMNRRFFLSYHCSDRYFAETVRTRLTRNGFAVYMHMNGHSESDDSVAARLAQAGHRLFIDSMAARQQPEVATLSKSIGLKWAKFMLAEYMDWELKLTPRLLSVTQLIEAGLHRLNELDHLNLRRVTKELHLRHPELMSHLPEHDVDELLREYINDRRELLLSVVRVGRAANSGWLQWTSDDVGTPRFLDLSTVLTVERPEPWQPTIYQPTSGASPSRSNQVRKKEDDHSDPNALVDMVIQRGRVKDGYADPLELAKLVDQDQWTDLQAAHLAQKLRTLEYASSTAFRECIACTMLHSTRTKEELVKVLKGSTSPIEPAVRSLRDPYGHDHQEARARRPRGRLKPLGSK